MELFSHVIIERDFPDESISNTSQMLSPINLKTIIRVLLHQPNLQAVLIQVFITKIIPRFGRKTPQATLPPPLPALRPSVRVQRVVMVSTRDQRIYKRDWWWTVAVRKGILLNFETNMQTRGKPHAVGSHGKRARTTTNTTIAYTTSDTNAKAAPLQERTRRNSIATIGYPTETGRKQTIFLT
ncbi:hypothetical protein SNK03_003794 [Fusarium graminearum]|nr:hypothetical protein FG05_10400 [Fusarium graminearum]PCD18633.1 hypothetical protein FGRA07_06386 [Fusarium graminearum]CAF3614149.1 unnamed protein product [Fusarium graminearum]CAG1972830.1 unnamed protein product [Fusarium graminearum]CAG1973486.1 unnamed protein product [Fusarium graminearum]